MCGIAGFAGTEQPFRDWFGGAVCESAHRGPDGDGWWSPGRAHPSALGSLPSDGPLTGQAALGFLRLAILDLSPAGRQPMVEPGRAALTLNGEIYNYLELRAELEVLGHRFTSSGDSEVLLRGWLEWGMEVLPRLNGMWAIALFEESTGSLLLSRDRFGEKPLHWTPWRGGLAYASEVKQLLRFPDVRPDLDLTTVRPFLASARPHRDGRTSWFQGIQQVEPGGWLRVDAGGTIRTGRYFDLRRSIAEVVPSSDPIEWRDRFRDGLIESVKLRLRSDVPVGTSLSSGVDSSAIAAAASHLGHGAYHTFTLGADDRRLDERPRTARFARDLGLVWHDVRADGAGFLADWDRMTWHQESPVASTSLYGQWKVMEAARAAGIVVMLDGQGADEFLGGYVKFFVRAVADRVRSRPLGAGRLALGLARHLGGPGVVVRAGGAYLGRFGGTPRADDLLLPAAAGGSGARTRPQVLVDGLEMRMADVERWSLPNLLAFVDRSAMAHSIETRLPFLDPGLASLSLAMPDDVLLRHGWSKWPLRSTLDGLGGTRPAWRRGKRWFDVPQAAWLRSDVRPAVEEWLTSPAAEWSGLVEPAAIRRFQADWRRRSPSVGRDDLVFRLVALDRFFKVQRRQAAPAHRG